MTYRTANALLARFAEIGIVRETTGGKRNRRFQYALYISLFAEPDVPEADAQQGLPVTR
jgi:hypothetical protein